jgi:Tfp pilus assembly pilus retraction ATPase PilT
MINSSTVRKIIEQNLLDKLAAAIETGTDEGMQTFNQALFKLVKAKLIYGGRGAQQGHQPRSPQDELPRHLPRRIPPHPCLCLID